MTDKIDRELKDELAKALGEGVSAEAMTSIKKKVDDILVTIEDDIMYRLKDDLAPNLASWVAELAGRAVESLLEGNEEQMRRYLSCERNGGWSGRSDGYGNTPIGRWHPVIHGKLFEQGCVALRKSIVEAHRDLLVNERILDLEDQVRSLVAQVNKAEAERDAMWERCRGAA